MAKTLPLTFRLGGARDDGYDYSQIERNDRAAIYSQSQDGAIVAFEVVRVRSHEAFEIGGNHIEGGESYPGNNAWGSAGWTYGTLAEAQRKFAAISAERAEEVA